MDAPQKHSLDDAEMSESKREFKKTSEDEPIIIQRLNPADIYKMIQSCANPIVDLASVWSAVSHIAYEALSYDMATGGVAVKCSTLDDTQLNDPAIYFQWLKDLLAQYVHLKLVICLPAGVSADVQLSQFVERHGWSILMHDLACKLSKIGERVDLHLVEMNLSMAPLKDYKQALVYYKKLIDVPMTCVLPSDVTRLTRTSDGSELLKYLHDECAYLILNSFGYMKFEAVDATRLLLSPLHESSLWDMRQQFHALKSVCFPDEQSPLWAPRQKVVLGIETTGLEFRVDDSQQRVDKFRIIALNDLYRMRTADWISENKDAKYVVEYDSVRGESLLTDRANRVVISFDSETLQKRKIKFAMQHNLLGIAVGSHVNDNGRLVKTIVSCAASRNVDSAGVVL